MPSSPGYKRNYKQEYKTQGASTAQKKARAARNKARAQAVKAGKVKKGDGKDVGHVKPLKTTGAKNPSGTRIQSRSTNRSHGGRIGNKAGKAAGGRKGKRK